MQFRHLLIVFKRRLDVEDVHAFQALGAREVGLVVKMSDVPKECAASPDTSDTADKLASPPTSGPGVQRDVFVTSPEEPEAFGANSEDISVWARHRETPVPQAAQTPST